MAKKFFRDVDTVKERKRHREPTHGRTWHGAALDDGEVILWRGRPKRGIAFSGWDFLVVPFSIFWAANAITAMQANYTLPPHRQSGFFFFGILGFVAFYLFVGRFLADALYRSRLTYVVTDQRVMIINNFSDGFGGVRHYDRRVLQISLQAYRNDRGTIHLMTPARSMDWWGSTSRDALHAAMMDKNRLFRIKDTRHVYAILAEKL